MVMEYIEEAWKGYKRNFWQILGAVAIVLVAEIVFISALLFLLISSLKAISSQMLDCFSNPGVDTLGYPPCGTLQTNTGFSNPGIDTLVFLIIILSGLFFILVSAGIVRVYADALRGHAKLTTMLSVARKRFWTIIAVNLSVLLIVGGLLLLIFVSAALFGFYLLLLFVPSILFMLLFSFVNQAVVIHDYGVFESIKKSVSIVKTNYLEFLCLCVVVLAIWIVISLVPIFGWILNLFVTGPVIGMAFTDFYLYKQKIKKRR